MSYVMGSAAEMPASTHATGWVARVPLFLLVAVLPLAVAGQNIGAGVIGALLIAQGIRRGRAAGWTTAFRAQAWPIALGVGLVTALVLATVLNPASPSHDKAALGFGYLSWVFLPLVAVAAQPTLGAREWRWLYVAVASMAAFWGLLALSQAIWGWHVEGAHVVFGPTRAQGFYSHPLTFAYAALLLFPAGAIAVMRTPRDWAAWALLGGIGVVLVTTASRTVQATAVLVLLANVFLYVRRERRWRLVAIVGLAVGAALAAPTESSRKIVDTLSGGFDVRSGYPDDRLAFWHANGLMFLERPVLGHGDHLTKAYRAPYYERIGLGGFERQYEAHNAYLQVAVNAGLIGLALYAAWFAWYLRRMGRDARRSAASMAAWQAIAALCVASLTQNAWQDAEVRFALTLVTVAWWLRESGKGPAGETLTR
jgi:O-antigen ligase